MKYYKISINIKNQKKPSYFIGSKIRGTLGYALKDEVCINPSFKCSGCFASKECLFYSFYEERNIAHNYRVDFKLDTDKYKFSLLLFNDAMKYTDSVEKAILASLSEYKSVESVVKIKSLKQKEKFSTIIKLTFITPLRIKKANIFLKDDISINDILFSIHRRNLEMLKEPFVRIEFSKSIKVVSKNLRYKELTRRSNTQKRFMNMGGIMGEIVLSGVDKDSYELLKLGEVIGVGKSTVFGLGKIKIEGVN